MYLKGQTWLEWSQWWVFQRFSFAAGMSFFRQIAVQVHQQNVDTAGPGPGENRPAALIRRNSPWRQRGHGERLWSGETWRWKELKGVNTVSQRQWLRKQLSFFIQVSASTVLLCIIPLPLFTEKERNSPGILPNICFISVNIFLGKF